MYLSSHEEFHTGVLYLGPINGPVEGILIAISMILVSAICGPDVWQQTVGQAMPSAISAVLPKHWQCEDLFVAFVLFALVCGHMPGWCVHSAMTI